MSAEATPAPLPGLAEVLAEQYRLELAAFRTLLDRVPDAEFGVGQGGHSAAWHALHIADWLRLTVMQDRTPEAHFLGWEDQVWAQALRTQAAPVEEDAGKRAVLARLDAVGAEAVATLTHATEADLSGFTFSPSAPGGQRPRLAALGLHLRHIAYHRGQVALLLKEVS